VEATACSQSFTGEIAGTTDQRNGAQNRPAPSELYGL
jgi:hypothetical protein